MTDSTLDWRQGVHDSMPVFAGYLSIGLAFGIVAAAANFSVWQIFLLSTIVYSGAAQFIIVAMLVAGGDATTILPIIALVSMRMFLQSLSAMTVFKGISLWQGLAIGSLITDESYGVLMLAHAQDKPVNFSWMNGVNLSAVAVWALSSVLGGLLGDAISDPTTFGLDFSLTAMFAGLWALSLKADIQTKKAKFGVIIGEIGVTAMSFIGLSYVFESSIAVLVATVVGALFAALFSVKEQALGQ